MQVKCLANFVNKCHDLSDRPDYYLITDHRRKSWLLEFVRERLHDTDIRVRDLTISKIAYVFGFLWRRRNKPV